MDIAELQVQARRVRETARRYVDLEAAFTTTMRDIADHLESLDPDQPLD